MPPLEKLPPPVLENLNTARMEVTLKINELPDETLLSPMGDKVFVIETASYPVKVVVSSKSWKKIQKNISCYPAWIAAIKGKVGPNFEAGFEFLKFPSLAKEG
jgi:hypothetical protein